jgi:hypothetical protein
LRRPRRCPRLHPGARPEPSTEATSSTTLALATNNLDIEIETPALEPRAACRPRDHHLGQQIDHQPQLDPSPNPDPEIKA